MEKEIIKEVEYIDTGSRGYGKMPYAIDPSTDDFKIIARNELSKYHLYRRENSGVRMGVVGFYKKNSTPKVYLWPGSIYHGTAEGILDVFFDFKLVWDEQSPNSILTEYPHHFENMIDNSIEGNNDVKRFADLFKFLGKIVDVREAMDNSVVLVLPHDEKSEDVDIEEPEYASTIRKYHGVNENKNIKKGSFMEKLKEAEGLTSIMDTEITSQKAVATGEKTPEIPSMDTSTAPIVDIYASGKTFEISDNSKIYQCVKIVKDIIDRQFFNQQKTTLSFQFAIDVKKHQVAFDISVNNNQLEDQPLEQLEKLADIITDRVNRHFDGSVDVAREIKPILTTTDTSMDNYDRTMMRITVTEKTKE